LDQSRIKLFRWGLEEKCEDLSALQMLQLLLKDAVKDYCQLHLAAATVGDANMFLIPSIF